MNTNEQMRRALYDARIALSLAKNFELSKYDANEFIEKIDAALDLPLRNCDVGTAKQQAARFRKFCKAHKPCDGCPAGGTKYTTVNCQATWSQLPHEESNG